MHHEPDAVGCLRVSPPLNDHEVDFLAEMLESGRTLRGTPTGRGRLDVPFARSAWDTCLSGCCLWWDAGVGEGRWMAATLEFIVEHLLRRGAVGEGHPRFGCFTFDHVVSGAVVAGSHDGRVLLDVDDNVVAVRLVPMPCDVGASPAAAPTRPDRRGPLPANVIQLRPRRA